MQYSIIRKFASSSRALFVQLRKVQGSNLRYVCRSQNIHKPQKDIKMSKNANISNSQTNIF